MHGSNCTVPSCLHYDCHCSDDGDVTPLSDIMVRDCEDLLSKLSDIWSQTQLDGAKNIWILKPSAKSRGRGRSASFFRFPFFKVGSDTPKSTAFQ